METLLHQLYEPALYGIFAVAALVAISLLFVNAPYGRHLRTGWGPSLSVRLGWIIMETPAVLTIAVMFFLSDRILDPVSIAFLVIWQSHYLYRTYIFPFKLRGDGKQMPWTIALMAIVFNVWNGFLNGGWLFYLGPQRELSWFWDPRFIGGVVLFFVGMEINRQSDRILFSLRAPGETGYKIPRGGLYDFVSMPAYFGELLEWLGFALLTWSVAGFSFAVFTAANLIPRAIANHRWYLEQFPDYPKGRKAVIPYVL